MITNIQISNFNHLKDINIDCPKLVILVGDNNAGKTYLLKAIDYVLSVARDEYRPQSFGDSDLPTTFKLKISYLGDILSWVCVLNDPLKGYRHEWVYINGYKLLDGRAFYKMKRVLKDSLAQTDFLTDTMMHDCRASERIEAQLLSKNEIIIMDEVESGLHPESIKTRMDLLQKSSKQTFMSTHSPMALNWLDDEVAIKSVHYVYSQPVHTIKTFPYFKLDIIKEKLEHLGPGEVFMDTLNETILNALDGASKGVKK